MTVVVAASAVGVIAHATSRPAVMWPLAATVAGVVVLVYLLGAHRVGASRGRPWSRWRTASFATAGVLAVLAFSPVLSRLASGEATAHMAQHLLLGMFVPLALALGAPVTLLLRCSGSRVRRGLRRVLRAPWLHVLAHPAVAAVLDVGGLYALYLTPLYRLSAGQDVVHGLVHVHFLLAGYLFAWTLAGPDPAPRRPGVLLRTAVLVLAGAGHAFLAKLLYAQAGALPPGTLHPVPDLQRAAQLMYYVGDIAEVLLAVALFATWYRAAGRRPGQPGAPGPRRLVPAEARVSPLPSQPVQEHRGLHRGVAGAPPC